MQQRNLARVDAIKALRGCGGKGKCRVPYVLDREPLLLSNEAGRGRLQDARLRSSGVLCSGRHRLPMAGPDPVLVINIRDATGGGCRRGRGLRSAQESTGLSGRPCRGTARPVLPGGG